MRGFTAPTTFYIFAFKVTEAVSSQWERLPLLLKKKKVSCELHCLQMVAAGVDASNSEMGATNTKNDPWFVVMYLHLGYTMAIINSHWPKYLWITLDRPTTNHSNEKCDVQNQQRLQLQLFVLSFFQRKYTFQFNWYCCYSGFNRPLHISHHCWQQESFSGTVAVSHCIKPTPW